MRTLLLILAPLILIGFGFGVCEENVTTPDVESGNSEANDDSNAVLEEIISKVHEMNLDKEELKNLIGELKKGEHINDEEEDDGHSHGPAEKHSSIKIVSFRWEYVRNILVLTGFFIVIGLFKLAYHHTRITKRVLPESCCLIFIGMLVGFLFIGDTSHASIKFLEFAPKVFFFYLLPPIILESAYSLKDRAFIENMGTILLYAVFGTVCNIVLLVAALLFLIHIGVIGGLKISTSEIVIFSSLIAAVDPVAVLAVFQEVGVNKMLYFMVFGESLFNDAVTIVCYNLAIDFQTLEPVTWFSLLEGLVSFFYVSLVGLAIGLICGFVSAFVTKYTKDVRVVEPVFLIGLAYLPYLLSEMLHCSGIIALIAAGLVQTHYAVQNVSYKSFTSVMYTTKVASTLCESLIFIILGVMLVNEREWFWTDWHPMFSFCSVVLCVVVRFLVTFTMTYFVNKFTGGVRFISLNEQFIMAYGGLRGAVSFSLAFMIASSPEVKNTVLGATYAVILFTNIIMGSTIKLFVKLLNIRLAKKDDRFRLFIEFNNGMVDNLSAGIEVICGYKDMSIINRMSNASRKYVRPYLERNYDAKAKKEGKLVEIDRAYTMREALITSPSQSSFKRQQTFDEMAESGVIPHDFLDEDGHVHPSNEEVELRTNELIKDVGSIRQLLNNPFEDCYLDRNLTHEEEKEKTRAQMKSFKSTAASRLSSVRKRIGILGKKKSVRRNATQQGLIHSAIATLGVHRQHSTNDQPSTSSSARVSIEDEEEGITMKVMEEEHPLVTIKEGDETAF